MIGKLRARPDLWRFAKFLVVGVSNTFFGFAVYAVLFRLVGLPPQPALAIAYVIGVIWNYFSHARLVFGTRGYRRMPLYVGAYVVTYALNAASLAGMIGAGVPPLLAQALILPPMAMLSFVLISAALTGRVPFLTGKG